MDDVSWGAATAHRVLTIAEVIWVVFLVAVVLLVVASTLLIANTIRLSVFARRREIEVMKLVGATNWFVRGPFMLEGLLCGIAGSALAVALLVVGGPTHRHGVSDGLREVVECVRLTLLNGRGLKLRPQICWLGSAVTVSA